MLPMIVATACWQQNDSQALSAHTCLSNVDVLHVQLGIYLDDAGLGSGKVLVLYGRGARGVAQEQLAPRLQGDGGWIAPASRQHSFFTVHLSRYHRA